MLISVRVINHPNGSRCRAGLRFDTTMRECDVTEEQYQAIIHDPYLEVVVHARCEGPSNTAFADPLSAEDDQCIAVTKSGERCRKVAKGGSYCRIHAPQ